jgi:ribosome-binding ATPase YchF (GTP1/OBG family)
MALEVGIVGLPNSGKTTLFNALTRAGAEITAYASVTDKPNVGMAAIADERLGRSFSATSARSTRSSRCSTASPTARRRTTTSRP